MSDPSEDEELLALAAELGLDPVADRAELLALAAELADYSETWAQIVTRGYVKTWDTTAYTERRKATKGQARQ